MDTYSLTDHAILKHIGETIRRYRLQRNISQKTLSISAGVSLSSVSALERGENVSLATLIPILRALNSLELIQPFLEEPLISPIAYARMLEGQKNRKRASSQKDNVTLTEPEW